MNIALAILHLYPAATESDFRVADHGNGQVIAYWGLPDPQPTQEQLETAWAAVQAVKAQREALGNARTALAAKYRNLEVPVRDRYKEPYTLINDMLNRGDVELARHSLTNMPIHPGDEQLHAEFLALFPASL